MLSLVVWFDLRSLMRIMAGDGGPQDERQLRISERMRHFAFAFLLDQLVSAASGGLV